MRVPRGPKLTTLCELTFVALAGRGVCGPPVDSGGRAPVRGPLTLIISEVRVEI